MHVAMHICVGDVLIVMYDVGGCHMSVVIDPEKD